jgi:diguanylate cyclase (GGDEF)-like protein
MNKILVIDNERDIVDLISDILCIHGFQVQSALNGKDGVKAAINFHPDLILCDITMPDVSGYDVLEILRQDEHTHSIPFIFLTAMGGMQDLRKGMRLGADDYLTKPVPADELVAAVNTRLEKHQQLTRRYKDEIEQTRHYLEITKNYDEVSGLPKKTVLIKRLNKFSDILDGNLKAILILRFNRFKSIVDIFGKNKHRALIRKIKKRIESVITERDQFYSLDDDEFGVLVTRCSQKKDLDKIAQKILFEIRKPAQIEDQEINCSVAIGIAYGSGMIPNPNSIISDAELALNAALADGYNSYRFFEKELKILEVDRLNLENGLHKALERNEFTLYYQPKFDSKSQIIIGSEALIRWDNLEYGLLSPSQFIPIAEETGLIIPIGEWILNSICTQLNEWKSAGLNPAPVAVNISSRQLEQKNFVDSIFSILEKSKIENELLEIELTESILIKNSQNTSKKLVKMRNQGMKVAIDDFGTGYSSLAYLSNFPFDKLKIDQSFIRDITTDKTSASLATSIISMAHSLGVRVIAEGVETVDQMEFLRTYNCDEIQGYYFSKPIPANDFTTLIKENNTRR